MITKYEYYKNKNGEIIETITHIMSEHGHFEKDGHRQGCHIAFSPDADQTGYVEVIEEGVTHVFPESFPDVIVQDEELEDGTEATGGNED